ncbi:MAG: methyltransferase domain-containing protein [Candidatus Woesearchaeota archaeon]
MIKNHEKWKDNYYNNISDGYTELHKEEQLKKINLIKHHLKIKPNTKVLDVGCGPYFGGWDKDAEGNKVDGLEIVGIDPSKELLKIVDKKVKKAEIGKATKIKTVNCGAENIPFADDYFDYVISITAVHNFTDIKKGISEMKRVLKPIGSAVITILKKSPKKDIIIQLIKQNFNIIKTIEEEKDVILIIR